MKKLLAILLAVLTLCMLLAGCAEKPAAPTAANEPASTEEQAKDPSEEPDATGDEATEYVPNDGKTVRIGLVQNNRSEPFHVNMYNGLVAACEAEGWELEAAICDGDAMKHITAVESFINRRVDLIVDFACLPDSGSREAANAKEAGIPLVTVDVDYGEDAYYFGVDNQQAGETLAEVAIPFLKEKFDTITWCVHLSSAAMSPTVKVRQYSCSDAILAAFDVELDEEHAPILDARTDNVRAASLTRDFLNAHPDDSNIVFVCNNDDRGFAAVSQIIALGREDDCAVLSYNGDPSARTDLKQQVDDPNYNSPWVASVAFNPQRYGEGLVAYAKEIFAGKAEARYPAQITGLTVDNVVDYLKEIGEE